MIYANCLKRVHNILYGDSERSIVSRALLTEREREIVSGEAEVSDAYRYQTISRIRKRFDRIENDLEALEKHGELADELRNIICEDSPNG